MKLLLDNNLSYKLCLPLQQHFAAVDHVKNLLTIETDDIAIWNYARESNYHILTKDNDFEEWSLLKGCPPKIIHLLCGNQTTSYILNLIVRNKLSIQNFINHSSGDCILKLYL
jgi:predicted nuclease of predicted toxin-antitoxin system